MLSLPLSFQVEYVLEQEVHQREKRSIYTQPTDPLWPKQWSLVSTISFGKKGEIGLNTGDNYYFPPIVYFYNRLICILKQILVGGYINVIVLRLLYYCSCATLSLYIAE